MTLANKSSLYDVLEVGTDASPQEIREAYLRLKTAYRKDSLATYTLIDPKENASMVEKIEEAYRTLSDSDKRREYDETAGVAESDGLPYHQDRPRIIAMERREQHSFEEDLLSAPATDLGSTVIRTPPPPAPIAPQPLPPRTATPEKPDPDRAASELKDIISNEVEWRGEIIRQVRMLRNVSIEEMAEYTKVSKTYIRAIEEDNYQILPAAVYLRGFIIQIAKKLGIPQEKVSNTYIGRYRQACPDKA